MSAPRKPKKSETLEIRLPHSTKQAFMARCRADGRSASEALRSFIDGELEPAPPPAPRRASWAPLRVIAGVLIAGSVGAVALPSLARPSPQTAFDRLDANGDHRVTFDEFSRGTAIDVQFLVGPAGSQGGRLALLPMAAANERVLPFGDVSTEGQIRTLLLRREFARIDADGDGAISFDEYRHGYDQALAPAARRQSARTGS